MTAPTARTGAHVLAEIASQPDSWERAAALAPDQRGLPEPGERVAVVGCGTSWFMAMAYAALREAAGHGETDAFTASELPRTRRYDRLVAITRSGTTTEICDLLTALPTPSVVLTTGTDLPAARLADAVVDLGFADERSVVQTRFATTALALLRAHLGEDLTAAVADARTALRRTVSGLRDLQQVTFLGQGWTVGLAQEAALKARESAQLWVEAYPATDYRHGPLAIAEPGRAVWSLGPLPDGLGPQVTATGARVLGSDLDPLAELVVAQRFAVDRALAAGLDPDHPRNLTRAVLLP